MLTVRPAFSSPSPLHALVSHLMCSLRPEPSMVLAPHLCSCSEMSFCNTKAHRGRLAEGASTHLPPQWDDAPGSVHYLKVGVRLPVVPLRCHLHAHVVAHDRLPHLRMSNAARCRAEHGRRDTVNSRTAPYFDHHFLKLQQGSYFQHETPFPQNETDPTCCK